LNLEKGAADHHGGDDQHPADEARQIPQEAREQHREDRRARRIAPLFERPLGADSGPIAPTFLCFLADADA
jgi:hypothetical protein